MSPRNQIEIEVWFANPPEAVFDAWVRPDELVHWFAADDWFVTDAQFVPSSGMAWRVVFGHPDGRRYVETGRVLQVERPNRLSFTLTQQGLDEPAVETDVTFEENSGGTMMKFRQSGFENPDWRDANDAGWQTCFGKLTAWFARS